MSGTAAMTSSALHSRVLSAYKRLLRLAQTWEAANPAQTKVERNYIRDETRTLFRSNRGLTSARDIADRLHEAEARQTMTEHYRNPYPRPVNVPAGTLAKREGKAAGKATAKRAALSRPIYVKSIDDLAAPATAKSGNKSSSS